MDHLGEGIGDGEWKENIIDQGEVNSPTTNFPQLLTIGVLEGTTNTHSHGASQDTSHHFPWTTTFHLVVIIGPLYILREEKKRREEAHFLVVIRDTLESMAQPGLLPIYDTNNRQYLIKTLEPLPSKPYAQMGREDWRQFQVTLEIIDLPPQDNISLAQRTNSVFFDKYMKDTHEIYDLKHKYQVTTTHNQFLGDKLKVLEANKASLQSKIISNKRKKTRLMNLAYQEEGSKNKGSGGKPKNSPLPSQTKNDGGEAGTDQRGQLPRSG